MLGNPWDEWKERQRIEDSKKYRAPKKLPTVKRLVTEEEGKLIKLLGKCSFGVGTWDKKFVRDISGATEISQKQSYWIYKTSYRYRRQLGLSDERARQILKIADGMLKGNNGNDDE